MGAETQSAIDGHKLRNQQCVARTWGLVGRLGPLENVATCPSLASALRSCMATANCWAKDAFSPETDPPPASLDRKELRGWTSAHV